MTVTPDTPENQGATTQSTSATFKPTKPKFGGLEQVSIDTWVPWTGGKPKADWTELEDINPGTIDPNQYRSTSISSQTKSKHYRTLGLTDKLSKSSNLQLFQKDLMEHMIEHGLDTITYAPNPSDPTEVVSVITDHARFNWKTAIKDVNDVAMLHYDSCDKSNQKDAVKLLMNSISDDLKKQLYDMRYDDDSFMAHWLHLIRIIRSVSVNRFEKIKNQIRARKVSSYPRDNIEDLASDLQSDWQDLHDAGMCDQNLTLSMLDAIMEAGGEDFKFPLRTKHAELNEKLMDIRHLSYKDAHEEMVKHELDVKSILTKAKAQCV